MLARHGRTDESGRGGDQRIVVAVLVRIWCGRRSVCVLRVPVAAAYPRLVTSYPVDRTLIRTALLAALAAVAVAGCAADPGGGDETTSIEASSIELTRPSLRGGVDAARARLLGTDVSTFTSSLTNPELVPMSPDVLHQTALEACSELGINGDAPSAFSLVSTTLQVSDDAARELVTVGAHVLCPAEQFHLRR
jgi:hypothetical protein